VWLVIVHAASAAVLGCGFLQNKGSGLLLPPLPAALANQCPPVAHEACATEPIDWFNMRLSSFYLSLALGSAGVAAAIWTFGGERAVFRREYTAGASSVAYVVGKSLVDIPFMALGAVIFAGVYLPMLRPVSNWVWHTLLFFCIEFTVYGLGYLLSVVASPSTALVVGISSTFAAAILSGIAPKYRHVADSYSALVVFWDVSFSRYVVEALIGLEAQVYLDEPDGAFVESVKRFATEYGFRLDAYVLDVVALVGLGMVTRLLTWFALVSQA